MYFKYLKEREGYDVFEEEGVGFFTYKFLEDTKVYIRDVFIVGEFRGSTREGVHFYQKFEKFLKESGAYTIYGSAVPSLDCTRSVAAMIKMGYKINNCTDDFISLIKEI